MAWNFDYANLFPADSYETMWNLVSALKNVGWIQKGSGNGATWANTANGGTVVPGPVASAADYHTDGSWVRLAMPVPDEGDADGNRIEIIIQRGGDSCNWYLYWSPFDRFVSGTPDVTIRPSATDEVRRLYPTNYTFLPGPGTYRQHVVAGGADEGYCFWMSGWYVFVGDRPLFFFGLDKLADSTRLAGDTFPYVFHVGERGIHNGWADNPCILTAYRHLGMNAAHHDNCNVMGQTLMGRTSTLPGTMTYLPILVPMYYADGNIYGLYGARYTYPALPPGTPDQALECHYTTKGVGTMFRLLMSGTLPTGATANMDGGTKNWMLLHEFWLPWNGSDPVM